jgi:hypothetical protein
MLLTKTNPKIQTCHLLWISLTEANRHNPLGHPSRMPFAKTNHQPQPGHPPRMSLAKANQQAQPGWNATSAGRFKKSLKRLSRRVKGKNWIFSLRGNM